MITKQEEHRLIAQAKGGDLDAAWQLYSSNIRLIKKLVNKFKIEGQSFDDLVQEAWFSVLNAIDKFDFNYDTRLFTLVFWKMRRDFLYLSRRQGKLVTNCDFDHKEIQDDKEAEELGEAVVSSLSILDEEEKEIVYQTFYLGLSQAEIARRNRCSRAWVNKSLSVIKAKLRRELSWLE